MTNMENEYCFEISLTSNFERRFQLNGGEYLMKYTANCVYEDNYYARNYYSPTLTIESMKDVPVFIRLQLYDLNTSSNILTKCEVFQTTQTELQINLKNAVRSSHYGTLYCCIKAVRYENWQQRQETSIKVTTPKNVTGSKGPVTECKLDNLSSDMRELFAQGELSDVVVSDGSTDFRAHKLVLAARSPVFCKMFQHPMKETCENRVIISDVSTEVLKELLTFIYTGVVTIKDMKMARDLYVVADKYDIKELRAVCSKYLKDVDLNSVLDTLTLADLYGDDVLKKSALEFIAVYYSNVKAHENWGFFMKNHQVLAMEVLSYVLDKKM